MALSLVTASGAFTAVTADRDAAIDVVGDAEQVLSMAPHWGPNGAYARTTADGLLAIDVTGGNPNVGPGGPIYGGQGVGGDQVMWFDNVFNISNYGTQSVFVWIEDDSGAVSFYRSTDDRDSIEGNASAFELTPGRTMEVGFSVNTSLLRAGDRALDGITVHAVASGAALPDDGTGGGTSPPADAREPSLLIGAPQTFASTSKPGKAYLFTSGVGGTVSIANADATFTGESANDLLGVSVAVAGDVNGDGETDYLLGAWGDDTAGSAAGATYLFYGPVSGVLNVTAANATFLGEAAGDGAGFTVAAAGDVNDDGFDDVLIGAQWNDRAGTNAGAAYLVYGSATLSGTIGLGATDAIFTGVSGSDTAGKGLAGVGDVNGDGFADIVIGAPGHDNVGSNEGAAYLVYGSSGLDGVVSLSSADATYLGEGDFDEAGISVAAGGDVDGDGFADVLVGAPGNDNAGGTAAGAVYIVYGGDTDAPSGVQNIAAADVKLEGDVGGERAGTSVAGAGDINDDGSDDILVGAPLNDLGGTNAGAAYVVFGSGTLGDATGGVVNLDDADAVFVGENAGDRAGDITRGVTGTGDIDGDGIDDFVVAASGYDGTEGDVGAVYLIHGSTTLSGFHSLVTADGKLVGETNGDLAGVSVDGGS